MKEYLETHYGKCKLDPCRCLKEGRLMGTLCPEWVPLGFESVESMIRNAEQIRKIMQKQ